MMDSKHEKTGVNFIASANRKSIAFYLKYSNGDEKKANRR